MVLAPQQDLGACPNGATLTKPVHFVTAVHLSGARIVYACKEGRRGETHTINGAEITCPACKAHWNDLQELARALGVIEFAKRGRSVKLPSI